MILCTSLSFWEYLANKVSDWESSVSSFFVSISQLRSALFQILPAPLLALVGLIFAIFVVRLVMHLVG